MQALNHDQVVAVHIDNGFMRKDESEKVEESLARLGLHLKGIETHELLLNYFDQVNCRSNIINSGLETPYTRVQPISVHAPSGGVSHTRSPKLAN